MPPARRSNSEKVPVPYKRVSRSGRNNIKKKTVVIPNSKLSGLEYSSRKARISIYTAVRTPVFSVRIHYKDESVNGRLAKQTQF